MSNTRIWRPSENGSASVIPFGKRDASLEIEMSASGDPMGHTMNGGRPITLKRLMDGEPLEAPTLDVERFLLANDVNLLGGHGDAGKSTTMFHTAVCYAVGRPVFGTLSVQTRGAVALLVPEDGERVARHHCDAIVSGLGLDEYERQLLAARLHIFGDDRPINLLTDTVAIGALLAKHGVALFFADPVANLIGGQKEDSEEVAVTVCDNLRRDLCRAHEITAVLSHHLRKPGRETVDAAATVFDLKGSAGWANHARQVWAVSKPKGGTTISLRLVKSNRLRTGIAHDVTLSIEADPMNEAHWLSCRLVDANLGGGSHSLTAGVGRAINDNERKALSALDDRHEPGRRVAWSEWSQTSGIASKDTLKSIKDRVLDAGLALAHPAGKHRNGGSLYNYSITARGRTALDTGWTSHVVKGERVT